MQVVAAFPGKDILIGETGWPSHGRMRDGALPSRINQARFVSEILDRARRDNFRVNLFEAYDEPWKRRWEGTVGGYWGLLDGDRSQAEISGRSCTSATTRSGNCRWRAGWFSASAYSEQPC